MDRRIDLYKFIAVVAIFICFICEVIVISSDDLSVGVKIVLGMIVAIVAYIINMVILHKISSLSCPKCRKPVMMKADFPDETLIGLKAYETCYFCGHEFEE